jgi:two-component system, cell cycle sensor histidine kinase and response regulator CckA
VVLVVDDEPAVRKPCCTYLARRGYEALGAANGEEALALFRERAHEISCVVLDLTMPEMDGSAVFREMKRLQPEMPVILSSGFNEEAALSTFGEQRPARFLQKPFRLEALQRMIDELAGRKTTKEGPRGRTPGSKG